MATVLSDDIAQVWDAFKADPENQDYRNRLVEQYLPLVKYNGERIWARLPEGVELDDLISAGVFGLMDAIDAFDMTRGVKFETYCVPRIRGAMLDELRTMDWVPRLVRSKASKLNEALKSLEAKLGRAPTEIELYRAVGLDHYARADDPLARTAVDGGLRRNFQGYTTDDAPALIGFGPSAISRLPQGYGQNTVSTHDWRSAIETGAFATRSGIALTWEDRVRGHVIEKLMCDMAVDLAAVSQTFALPRRWFAAELDKLKPLQDAQLISITGNVITVTGPFRQAARLAAAAFDTRLDQGSKRHAMTA